CRLDAFPSLEEATQLAEVARWDCISPRVAYVLKQLPLQTGVALMNDLLMRQLDYKTALTDFDFLQLAFLASQYPGIRAALNRPRHLLVFFFKVAQESAELSVSADPYFQSIAAPRLRFQLT